MEKILNNPSSATPKSILITGAGGFIGGFLVEEALRRGYTVWAGVRASSNRSRLSDPRIRFIDLRYDDEEQLLHQLRQHVATQGCWQQVIHNAGLTKTVDKRAFTTVNALYSSRLIEALGKSGALSGKFLLMSSLSSFGMGDEKGFTPIRLTDPQQPNTAYGKSKLEAENYLRRQHYFPYIILRPTGVYGPGERDYFLEMKSIRSGFDFATAGVPQRITFIYVKDLARAAFLALENEALKNREYFVADGDVYTDESFARLVQELLGKRHLFRARVPLPLVRLACYCSEQIGKLLKTGMTLNSDKYLILKQRNWICDVAPLQDELPFRAEYSLREGLMETIAWYRREGWL
ncbi:NAD(P)-dependent oxidoreductase [Parabacteroides sp. OttesenSCG-928-N08]|nr:NAD(P)-dependent oxidoreductase [Parabacteroides sp. OttesenSCG-928-N08]